MVIIYSTLRSKECPTLVSVGACSTGFEEHSENDAPAQEPYIPIQCLYEIDYSCSFLDNRQLICYVYASYLEHVYTRSILLIY